MTLRFPVAKWRTGEFGMRQLERVKADLEEIGQVEQMPKMEGRQMIMVIAPKKKHCGFPVVPNGARNTANRIARRKQVVTGC